MREDVITIRIREMPDGDTVRTLVTLPDAPIQTQFIGVLALVQKINEDFTPLFSGALCDALKDISEGKFDPFADEEEAEHDE